MRVLVTRPETEAEETATLLRARGHEAVIAPLLDIRFRDGAEIALDGVQAVLVTSANGIRALARRTKRRDVKVFAVGAQSAAAAREWGFADVEHAGGDAAALADLASARLKPQEGILLHAAGVDTRGDLAGALHAQGFTVRTETLYEARVAASLPADAAEAMRAGKIDAVLVYSPRSARTFVDLAIAAGLAPACAAMTACCISNAAADELGTMRFREIRIARNPDQDSLLALLA